MGLIWIVIVGGAAGWLGGQLMKPGEYGARVDIIGGVVGAFLSAFLMRVFSDGLGAVWSVIVAIVGAGLFMLAMRRFINPAPVVTPRTRRRP